MDFAALAISRVSDDGEALLARFSDPSADSAVAVVDSTSMQAGTVRASDTLRLSCAQNRRSSSSGGR